MFENFESDQRSFLFAFVSNLYVLNMFDPEVDF